nr:MAG TPA: hypothetical protein [Caudoviricetes sp.]
MPIFHHPFSTKQKAPIKVLCAKICYSTKW